MSARLIAVSGLGPKEPAAFVVEADGRRLLLDCGEGPEPGTPAGFRCHRPHRRGRAQPQPHRPRRRACASATASAIRRSTRPRRCWRGSRTSSGHAIPIRGTRGGARHRDRDRRQRPCARRRVAATRGRRGASLHGRLLDRSRGSMRSTSPPPTPTMIIDGSYGDAEEALDRQQPQAHRHRGARTGAVAGAARRTRAGHRDVPAGGRLRRRHRRRGALGRAHDRPDRRAPR